MSEENTVSKNILNMLIASGRIPHTVVIENEDGEAMFLANAAVCLSESISKPCGVCSACKKFQNKNHPNVLEFHGSGASASVKIDVARQIRQDVFVVPNDPGRKVYIIHDADSMTDQAANALLKTLEEPPKYALFILCCSHISALLPTIRSRSTVIRNGNFGSLISENKSNIRACEIAEAVSAKNEISLLKLLKSIEKDRMFFKEVLSDFLTVVTVAAKIPIGIDIDENQSIISVAKKLSAAYTLQTLINMSIAVNNTIEALSKNAGNALAAVNFAASLKNAVNINS